MKLVKSIISGLLWWCDGLFCNGLCRPSSCFQLKWERGQMITSQPACLHRLRFWPCGHASGVLGTSPGHAAQIYCSICRNITPSSWAAWQLWMCPSPGEFWRGGGSWCKCLKPLCSSSWSRRTCTGYQYSACVQDWSVNAVNCSRFWSCSWTHYSRMNLSGLNCPR